MIFIHWHLIVTVVQSKRLTVSIISIIITYLSSDALKTEYFHK